MQITLIAMVIEGCSYLLVKVLKRQWGSRRYTKLSIIIRTIETNQIGGQTISFMICIKQNNKNIYNIIYVN